MHLHSFKLRFHDTHVRVLPAEVDGRTFTGPGVDVRAEDAHRCFDLAAPMVAWLMEREPSVVLRAMSVDLETRRVIVSFEDAHATERRSIRPMVLRIDPPDSSVLIERAAALIAHLVGLAKDAIAKRAT